jgi:hypothetical protein
MKRPALLVAFVPYLYLIIAALAYHPVFLQPKLTSRLNAADYQYVIDESDGDHAVRIGFALDMVFVVAIGVAGLVALVESAVSGHCRS